MTAGRTLLTFAGLLVAGCTAIHDPCFTPASVVDDPRIFSIRVDPPEASVDLAAGSVETLAVRMLAGTASRGQDPLRESRARPITEGAVTARLCLAPSDPQPTDPPDCPADAPIVAGLAHVPDAASPLLVTPDLALLRQALAQDPLHGLAGIRLRLQLSLQTGQGVLSAVKTLVFRLPEQSGTINHGLEITSLDVLGETGWRTYAPGEAISLVVARTHGLRPRIGPGPGANAGAEEYVGLDGQGQLATLRESVTYKFYAADSLFIGRSGYSRPGQIALATYSGLPTDQATEPAPGDPEPPYGLVLITPVIPYDQLGSFWIVARDGRGAEAALLVDYVAIDERPGCGGPPPHDACPQILFGCL